MIKSLFIGVALAIFLVFQTNAMGTDRANLSNGINFKKERVIPCGFDYGSIDYCDAKHLSFYSLQFKLVQNNFFNNYSLIKLKENATETSLIVFDQTHTKVYPFQFTIGNYVDDKGFSTSKEATIEFNLKDNKICVNGSVYSYKESITNDKSCFEFSANGNFKKVTVLTKEDNISNKNEINNKLPNLKSLNELPITFVCNQNSDVGSRKCSGLDSDWTAVAADSNVKSWYLENKKKLPSMEQVQLVMLPIINDSSVLLARQLIELDEGSRYNFIIITIYKGRVNYKVLGSEVIVDKNFVISGRDDKEGTTQVYYRIGLEGNIHKIKRP